MKSDFRRTKELKHIIEYGYIFILAVLLAFMYQLFVVKNHFAPA